MMENEKCELCGVPVKLVSNTYYKLGMVKEREITVCARCGNKFMSKTEITVEKTK